MIIILITHDFNTNVIITNIQSFNFRIINQYCEITIIRSSIRTVNLSTCNTDSYYASIIVTKHSIINITPNKNSIITINNSHIINRLNSNSSINNIQFTSKQLTTNSIIILSTINRNINTILSHI